MVDELAQPFNRTSLLDVMEGMLRGKQMYTRMLLVGTITEESEKADVEKDTEMKVKEYNRIGASREQTAVLKEILNLKQDNNIGGVFYTVGTSFIHMLESSTEGLFHFITQPQHHAIRECKVLYFTEVHGVRAFNGWTSIKGATKAGPAIEEAEMAAKIFTVYKRIVSAAASLEEGSCLEAPRDIEAFPSVDDLNAVCGSTKSFTLDEFIQFYLNPPDTTTICKSELLWPMAPSLNYYDDH